MRKTNRPKPRATTLYIGADTVSLLDKIRETVEDGGPHISASSVADFCILQEARRRGLAK